MKPYPAYKESGIAWVDQIPSHWESKRMKFIADLKSGDGITSESINSEGEYPVYGGNGLRGYTASFSHEGDYVLIGRQGALCGNINYATGKFWASEHAVVATLNENHAVYWFGELLRVMNLNQYSQAAAQPGLAVDVIKNLPVPCPPVEEQQAIADYLDRKTAVIDTLIAKKERQIALLQEQKTAVINHAVTKGLNPHAPRKDSAIPWLGQIPAHWEVWKFKHFAPIITCGLAATPDYFDEGIPFLSAQNVKNRKLVLDKYNFISEELHQQLTKNRKPEKGDILVSRVGTIGEACVVDVDFEFSLYVSLTHIRVEESLALNYFIVYFFATNYCQSLNFVETYVGAGVGNLNVKNVERYRIPIPPLAEQKEIVAYLDRKIKEIDLLIEKEHKIIQKLQEYRTAVISAAVTGKIDVREAS